MAAEFSTPLDDATGMPLPIAPRADLPPVPVGRMRNIERVADWHHPFHPRAELMSGGLGSIAVRNCRIQWAEYDDHHHKYHGAYVGPVLPEGEADQFQTVVLAAAGYVPEAAIGFGRFGRPYRKQITEEERWQLWQSGQLRVGNLTAVKDFLIDYALRNDFTSVRESTIDEFLHGVDPGRKQELGGTLLGIAAYSAAEPLEDLYKLCRQQGLMRPEVARRAGRFVFGAITTHRRNKALTALAQRLAA